MDGHVCLSGLSLCSGLDPCEACAGATDIYVLVPAMKAIGIDQRGDPRVVQFLRTYAEARRGLLAAVREKMQMAMPAPAPVAPQPAAALTEAELEAMATPMVMETSTSGLTGVPDTTTETAPQQAQPPAPSPPPPGLMSDAEFRAKFPGISAEEVIVGIPEEAITKTELPSEPSIGESGAVGIAPTEPPPPSTAQAKATPGSSANLTAADTNAETTKPESVQQAETSHMKAEATSNG